jgi:hypothetical protein
MVDVLHLKSFNDENTPRKITMVNILPLKSYNSKKYFLSKVAMVNILP